MSANIRPILDTALATGATNFAGMPQGEKVFMQCDGDVDIAWFNDTDNDYDTAGAETLSAPGGEVACPHSKVKFTTGGTVNVRIVKVKR